MSSLSSAMAAKQVGENNHFEYKWSVNGFETLFSQLYFQLVRTKDFSRIKDLEYNFNTLLTNAHGNIDNLLLLAKLTLHTRDCVGKGERDLFYMLLICWWKYDEKLAYYIFETAMLNDNNKDPFGSWKDVKYLCLYIKTRLQLKDDLINNTFINWLVELTNYHLKQDWDNYVTQSGKNISLLAKWVPREKSKKFGWLHNLLVKNMFNRYYNTANSSKCDGALKRADTKAKREYRLICSTLNKALDTTQIKQCNSKWREIDPNKVTSITFSKQKKALFNQKIVSGKIVERSANDDRIKCRDNFTEYINKKKENNETIKGKRCSIYDFVKDAIKYGDIEGEEAQLLKETINSQWLNNSQQNLALNNMIPLVDTSGSMESDNCQPLYNAIGLGIRISEKTSPAFRNRILTFTSEPTWVTLDEEKTFCDKVSKVRKSPWGMTTNIYKAFNLILRAIETSNLSHEQVENLTLVILSDMQINSAIDNGYNSTSLYENIKRLFHEKGLNISGRPFNPPNVLFWNLRSTHGFPTQTTENNITMLSGFSPLLLNVLCEKGFEELKKVKPFDMLINLLETERYSVLDDFRNLFV